MDNIFLERLWRSVNYEEVYLKEYHNVREAVRSLGEYFRFFCNLERPHQSLGYMTAYRLYYRGPSHDTGEQHIHPQGRCASPP